MEKIIYNVGNQVHVLFVIEGYLAADQVKFIPAGHTYEILAADDDRFPADKMFRDAWSWAGIGQPVVEDLERSRTIALEMLKTVASESALVASKAESILESTTYSTVQIRDAYAACKTDLTNSTTIAELKACVNSFTSTYGEVD